MDKKLTTFNANCLQFIKPNFPISESGSSTTNVDLPPSSRVPLPLELNCEIFKCLKLPVQRKFIWGLGRDIYGMFDQKLLKKVCMKYTYKYKKIENDMHLYKSASWHFDLV
jgi:hypothetical protein